MERFCTAVRSLVRVPSFAANSILTVFTPAIRSGNWRADMKYTVLGASGFIGSHVANLARREGHDVDCPGRDENLDGRHLGHVIYSIGLTSDFRQRPHDTVTAHVTKLQEILTRTTFDSWSICHRPASTYGVKSTTLLA